MSGDLADEDQPEIGIPPIWLGLAARGSIEAQRLVRDSCLRMAEAGEAPFGEAFAAAEVLARMAASYGLAEDKIALAKILITRSDKLARDRIDVITARGLAVAELDEAADAGHPVAVALMDAVLAHDPDGEIIAVSREIRSAQPLSEILAEIDARAGQIITTPTAEEN